MRLHFYKDMFFLFLFFAIVFFTISCGKNDDRTSVRKEINYQVCLSETIPDELRLLIEERKEKPFQMTYENSEHLYLAVGYGRQKSTEYVVAVREIFRSEKKVVIDTILVNGSNTKGMEAGKPGVCPFVVLRCDKMEEIVLFCAAEE